MSESRDSSVYRRTTGWTSGVLFAAGARDFSLLHNVHTDRGAHSASYTMGTGCCFQGVKRPGREADHLVPRLRMMELYLHSPICLHGIVVSYLSKGITDSDDVEAKEEELVQAVLQGFLFRSCSKFVYSMFQVVAFSW
jgi:hypothetical protein